jgi:hypothetical protein
VRSPLLAVAVVLLSLAACSGCGSEPPTAPVASAPKPAAAPVATTPQAAVPAPGGGAPATGGAVTGGSPVAPTAPVQGENPPAGEPTTGGTPPAPKEPSWQQVADCEVAHAHYITCEAIAVSREAGCEWIKDAKLRSQCVAEVGYFTAARGAPGDSSWRFPDSWMQLCGNEKENSADTCAALRDAVRSGQASGCPSAPAEMNAFCRAMIAGDASGCGDDKTCRESVSRSALVARGGLKAVADGTNTVDKSYARAALGDAAVCKGDLGAAMNAACVGVPMPAAPAGAPGRTQPLARTRAARGAAAES